MLLKFSRGLHWTSGFACHSTQPCGFAPEKLRPLLESAFSENSVPRVEPWSFVCCLSAPSPLFQMLLFECLARICKLPSHVRYQLDSRRLLPVRATEGSWEDMKRVEEIFFFPASNCYDCHSSHRCCHSTSLQLLHSLPAPTEVPPSEPRASAS